MTEKSGAKDIKVKGHISIGGITLSINEEDPPKREIHIGEDARGTDLGTLTAIAVSFGQLEKILQEIKLRLERDNAGD